jgi:hypothetical protein
MDEDVFQNIIIPPQWTFITADGDELLKLFPTKFGSRGVAVLAALVLPVYVQAVLAVLAVLAVQFKQMALFHICAVHFRNELMKIVQVLCQLLKREFWVLNYGH